MKCFVKTGVVLAVAGCALVAHSQPAYPVYFDSVVPFMDGADSIVFDGMRVDGFGFKAL